MSAASADAPGHHHRLVKFRAMTPGDVPAVGALERAAYPYPWSDGIFRDCLRVGYLCRVADVDGAVVAYGIVAMGAGEAHILNLCVRDDLRGRGVGRQMLMLLLERAKKVLEKELAPAAWNIGINDGAAAGQTVPHLHIHLIPRYAGDRKDPRGGIRWVIPEKADYWSTR